jgi:hypothetical protein
VPTRLPATPRAKYTLIWGEFTYLTTSSGAGRGHHTLSYVAMPPFGRRLYPLETERWSFSD